MVFLINLQPSLTLKSRNSPSGVPGDPTKETCDI